MPKQSSGERAFLFYWRALSDTCIEWQQEFRFHPTRKWRFDFSLPDRKIAIEIDGGTGKRGKTGHTSFTGYRNDREKDTAALLLGWKVMRFTPEMLAANPQKCINQILEVLNDG